MKLLGLKTIAIVGSGFSGTVTAINLLRLAQENKTSIKLVLIDTADSFGKGLAYSTRDDNLVLNVPTGNMSAFPDKPDDFLKFCNGMDASLLSGSFVFRRIYGEYLQARLSEAGSNHKGRLVEVRDVVTAIRQKDGASLLTLQTGTSMEADYVILAFGHFPPRPLVEFLGMNFVDPEIKPDFNKDVCLDNPWDISSLDRLPADKDILIVGAGHTAIDTLFRLESRTTTRKIYLVSRHGHTPNGHRKADEFVKMPSLTRDVEHTIKMVLAENPTIRALFSAIRKLVQRHVELNGNWRDVINSLRQITPEIWQRFPAAERGRFLRHVAHHWDVLRHRLAPMAMYRLDGLITSGRVEIVSGRITQLQCVPDSKDICATVKQRGTDRQRDLKIGSAINCTGPNYDIHRIDHPLIRQLVGTGILRQDDAKIGFEIDENYRCSVVPNLFYAGPMLKARYWEAIAVPELRVHSLNLAKTLLAQIQQAE